MTRFFEYRSNALYYWINKTNRIITDRYSLITTDDLVDTFECKWQRKSTNGHISIFCSLGEWASNITDILKDESLDKCYFENEEESQTLYRYFTRLLLVVSEIITDFQDIYIVSLGLNPNNTNDRKKAAPRKFLFGINEVEPDPLTEIMSFINNICKHKTQHIHKYHHHLPVYFADNADTGNLDLKNYIHIKNLDFSSKRLGIIMPKLSSILYTIILCYDKLDYYFGSDQAAFKRICDAYS
jgi:hypothetical protein